MGTDAEDAARYRFLAKVAPDNLMAICWRWPSVCAIARENPDLDRQVDVAMAARARGERINRIGLPEDV